jgi:hypothetical protein
MKELFHKIMSVSMAMVVLFSTMSFTIDMHFCEDTLVTTSVFSKAESCGMDKVLTNACEKPDVKKDCCKEKQLIHQSNDTFKTLSSDVFSSNQVFIASYIYTYAALFNNLPRQIIPFKNYDPPIVVKDIQLFDEVFLI